MSWKLLSKKLFCTVLAVFSSQLQTTHPRYHLLPACDGHSQNAAKWPYSVSVGLTPGLVCVPGPCCPLPLHLPKTWGDSWGLWVQQGCLCQPMELVSLAHAGCGAGQRQHLLMSYKHRSWAWQQKSGLLAVQGSSHQSAQQRGLPSHTGCTTWSFGVSSTSERESQGNWKCVRY